MNDVISIWPRLLSLVVFIFGVPNILQGQSITEASMRISLMISREFNCAAPNSAFTIAAVPAQDESKALAPQILSGIESMVLDAIRRETFDCVRITEVARAFDTLAYVQNIGRWDNLGAEQRARVASELSNADATITILLNQLGGSYTANVTVVELVSGQTLASVRAEIPDALTLISCGAAAAAEARGLATLAASLVERLPGAKVLYVAPATYQDSLDTLGYGGYISDQFTAALSQLEGNVITGADVTVRKLDDIGDVSLGPQEHAVTLRYWPCEDLSAARLSVVAASGQGDVVTLSQDLSLAALPAGLAIVPPVEEETPDTATNLTSKRDAEAPDLGFLSVEPRLIQVGQLLTISAEPSADCNPFFFDVSASGKLTPIPLDIFDTTEISPGLFRYDNNVASKYGLIVQPDDEPGMHRLGFICQPPGLSQEDMRDVLRQLRREHADSTSGIIVTENTSVLFNTINYEILR